MIQAEQIRFSYFHSFWTVFVSILQLIAGRSAGHRERNSLDWLEVTFQ